jgi:hypothetical protein
VPSKTKLYVEILGERHVHGLAVGSRYQSVRLRNHTKRTSSAFVCGSGQLEYNLVRVVVLCRHNCKDDTPGFLHVRLDYVLDQLNIGSGLLLGLRMNEPRQIHDCEVRTVRTRDLDAQEILGERSTETTNGHRFLGVFNQVWKRMETVKRLAEVAERGTLCFVVRVIRNNGDADTNVRCFSKH